MSQIFRLPTEYDKRKFYEKMGTTPPEANPFVVERGHGPEI